MRLMITGLMALFATAAFAHPSTTWGDVNFRAVIHLPHNPKMGDTEIPGKLYVQRRAAIDLACNYSTGVTVSLTCSGSGYLLRGFGTLQDLNVTLPGGGEVTLKVKKQ